MTPSIKQIVKDNMTRFSFYRTGYMFYTVDVEGRNISSRSRLKISAEQHSRLNSRRSL